MSAFLNKINARNIVLQSKYCQALLDTFLALKLFSQYCVLRTFLTIFIEIRNSDLNYMQHIKENTKFYHAKSEQIILDDLFLFLNFMNIF